MKIKIIKLSILLLTALQTRCQTTPSSIADTYTQTIPVQKAKDDIALLRKALEEVHPALYNFTSKKTFDSLFTAVDKNLTKDISGANFFVLASEIVSKIKCGHSRVSPSDEQKSYLISKGKVFPYQVKIINSHLYIADSAKAGTEIISINKIPSSAIISKFYEMLVSDGNNETMRYNFSAQFFPYYLYIVYGPTEQFNIEAIDFNTTKKYVFSTNAILASEIKKLNSLPLIDLKTVNKNIPTALLTIKTFETGRLQKNKIDFNKKIDSIFSIIKTNNIQNLIIDLRNNAGGDPALAAYLFSHITQKQFQLLNKPVFKTNKPVDYLGDQNSNSNYQLYYKGNFTPSNDGYFVWQDPNNPWYGTYSPKPDSYQGKVILLLNGGSFSTSGFFGSLIRCYNRGTIIGQESGGASACNDCHATLILPNSKLSVEIPRATITMNIPNCKYEGHGIIPDHVIPESADNTDNILKYALTLNN